MTTITTKQITDRLSNAELYAPNYFGRVPSDWEEVAASVPMPTVDDVRAAEERNPGLDLDGLICAAARLPDGYEGVAIDVR